MDISLHRKLKPGIWAPGLLLSDSREELLRQLGKKHIFSSAEAHC